MGSDRKLVQSWLLLRGCFDSRGALEKISIPIRVGPYQSLLVHMEELGTGLSHLLHTEGLRATHYSSEVLPTQMQHDLSEDKSPEARHRVAAKKVEQLDT